MRLGTVSFLVSLAGLAGTLPQLTARTRAPAAAPAQAGPSDPEVARMMEAELKRRYEGAGVEDAGELAKEAAKAQTSLHNPVIDQLLSGRPPAPGPAGSGFALPSLPSGLPWKPTRGQLELASTAVWGAPAALLMLAVLFAIVDLKGLARALAGLCHGLCGFWLMSLAGAAPALFRVFRVDVWGALPGEFWGVPAGALLVSAAILNFLDMNSPVWNKTVLSLAAPVMSCLAVLALR